MSKDRGVVRCVTGHPVKPEGEATRFLGRTNRVLDDVDPGRHVPSDRVPRGSLIQRAAISGRGGPA
jgi:hypothetical protein